VPDDLRPVLGWEIKRSLGTTRRDDGAEVVTVATPNFTHYEITKACLEAGLHVICEKPVTAV
jgi:predicted dehydrogenase